MPTRHDVSGVPFQGGYIAKQCPVKIQWNVLEPAERAPVPDIARIRMDAGIEFEADIEQSLTADPTGRWLLIADGPRDEVIHQTVEAMHQQAEAIFGGWLPADAVGRRVGKPDLLVYGGDGYVPVDVKHHLTLEEEPESDVLVSDLSTPTLDNARTHAGWALRKHKGDALQLAHYRRMLQAMGHDSASSMAGIIGKERLIVWYDLDEPMWQTPAKSDGKKRKQRTSMEIYDFEFDFRLDIAAVAAVHAGDPSVELLVVPLHCGECGDCDWRDYCGPIYRQGSGDPSLLPGLTFPYWSALRAQDITDRQGVANLHYPTARLAADGLNVSKVLSRITDADTGDDAAVLVPRSKKQAALLETYNLVTVGDVAEALDPSTAVLAGSSVLANAIIHARAALGPDTVYRLAGNTPFLSRFDIELDIDMENGFDGLAYLWGVLVTDRSETGLIEPGYYPFVSWSALDDAAESDVFRGFWEWLSQLRSAAEQADFGVGFYYWSSAEESQIRRITADTPLAADTDSLIASQSWVDLLPVYRKGWTNGRNAALKTVATSIGYSWDVDNPDGGHSMLQHLDAVAGDETAQNWLLDYNRGDVEATQAVREWMDGPGRQAPLVSTE